MTSPPSFRRTLALRSYTGALALALGGILVANFSVDQFLHDELLPWVALTAMLAMTEFVDLNFHERGARVGLSAAEALFLPLLVHFSLEQVVLAVTVAMLVVPLIRRPGLTKAIFNMAQYGCAAAVAAAFYGVVKSGPSFGSVNLAWAVGATVLFTLLTHGFVLIAVALSQGRPLRQLARAVGSAAGLNLLSNLTLGLLFASAYAAGSWTVLLFPLPLAGFYLGYRAILNQQQGAERVERLHAASRALASSRDLSQALVGFLLEVREIVHAVEARTVVKTRNKVVWSGATDDRVVARMEAVDDPAMLVVLSALEDGAPDVLVTHDDPELQRRFGEESLLAVPLLDKEFVLGYIALRGRLGADDFNGSDVRLLQALANELVVTLDAYRLFSTVSEERERFKRIFNGSKEGICLLDDRAVVRAWNPALEQITGYTQDDMLGRVWSTAVLMRDDDQRRIEKLDLVKVPDGAELELVTRAGPTRYVAVLSDPVTAGDEQAWVVLVRDVTAQRAAEEAKSDFLSTISHELRTPLTTIKGSLQILEKGVSQLPNGTAEQMIAVTRRGAERLEQLVMNLLAVSQLEAGGIAIEDEELHAGDAARIAIERILRDHPRTAVSIGDADLRVRADGERLIQAIEQLLDNAAKFGGAGGEVAVDVRRANGYVVLAVTDEGPGIPAADRERIFERFVRLGAVLTRETQGAGVGLFIVRRSIEAMRGSVWVEDAPGGGSRFCISLPAAYPAVVADHVA